jgi:hypothetical protein
MAATCERLGIDLVEGILGGHGLIDDGLLVGRKVPFPCLHETVGHLPDIGQIDRLDRFWRGRGGFFGGDPVGSQRDQKARQDSHGERQTLACR